MEKLPDTFHVTKVGKGQFTVMGPMAEVRPYEFFIKEDGAIDDKPSFAIVGVHPTGKRFLMQISAAMFRVAYEEMKAIYEIDKKSN